MWPFSRNKGIDTSEIAKDLPDNIKEFFEQSNPDSKHQSIFEISPQQKRVNDILLKHEKSNNYSFEFEKYKQMNSPKKVTSINCAELQQKVVECFRGWSFTMTTQCQQEIQNHTSCIEIQNRALKKLYYDDCISIEQCNKIRFIIDKIFIESFGQFGENINDETKEKFDKKVDKAFYKVWK